MVLTLDKTASRQVLDQLKEIIGIKAVQTLELATGYTFQEEPFVEV